ncbi:acetyl-CoA C-acyltransferase [Confluentibacter flavum]|uniref:acetyl-CoA C-acetyltransferase n=1 Tax=Confluentibacter flavum TaxID=1909700 RepID=A0A2N3HHW0_9FLAO|nr:acetyl-CoA C-acyltransferase [Confluentibacter flavum]
MDKKNIYILSGSRTPMGSHGGVLATIPAIQLGAIAIKSAIEKAKAINDDIETVIFGNVLSANLGQAPARQASMDAGLPENICATTVNKVCASGMKAVSMLFNDIYVGNCEIGVAGGMENMSQVPHYLPNARFGLGFGNSLLVDGLAKDGLTDVYNNTSMGVSGDKTAEKYNISRETQDNFAEQSYKKAANAWQNGFFANEITSVIVPQRRGDSIEVNEDETYKKANFEKMRQLKPAFSTNGTVTAANASPMSDGASALVLASEAFVNTKNLKPLSRIIAYAEAEQDPMFFTTSPVLATQKVLERANLTIGDIDFFEVNEAFSVVPIAFMQMLDVDPEKVNVFGGAVAIGHPLGSSGSRIIVTLLNVLQSNNGKYGLATICNGGGGASSIIIENLNYEQKS